MTITLYHCVRSIISYITRFFYARKTHPWACCRHIAKVIMHFIPNLGWQAIMTYLKFTKKERVIRKKYNSVNFLDWILCFLNFVILILGETHMKYLANQLTKKRFVFWFFAIWFVDVLGPCNTYNWSEFFCFNKVEDYYEIIEEPMDFGTMRAKLHEGLYTTLEQFEVCSWKVNYCYTFFYQHSIWLHLSDTLIVFVLLSSQHYCVSLNW